MHAQNVITNLMHSEAEACMSEYHYYKHIDVNRDQK